jgi:glycosyltransferase involved in cell wall biosynthesis
MSPPSVHRERVVRQFGPEAGTGGGIASALEVIAHLPFDHYRVELTSTWTATAPLWGVGPWLRALGGLSRRQLRMDVAHVHLAVRGSFVREGAIAAAIRARGVPLVITLHGGELASFAARHRHLVRTVLGFANAIVALGPAAAELVEPWTNAPIIVVPNAVELPADPHPAGEQPEQVLYAGDVTRLKGVDVLVDAWRRVHARRPHASLVIAGPPGNVDVEGIPGIDWIGAVPRDHIIGLLTRSRVAVLPSRVEALPMFLLEAMAAARPIVTTPVGDVPWLVDDLAPLVAIGDPNALADALEHLLDDPGAATATGAALRARARDHYAPGPVATLLESVYNQVLDGGAES